MDDFAEFRHFKYLLALAEHGNFRAAAEAVHTTQPNLSHQVMAFQSRYRVQLYRCQKNRTIVLTPAGEALKTIARDVLDVRTDAIAALEAIHKGEATVMRLGCTSFIDQAICSRAKALQKVFLPASSVKYINGDTGELLNEILRDELDAALVSLPVEDERLRVEIVRRERMVVCLPADHPLAHKSSLAARDLTDNLTVFRHPAQHPAAHERLRELLAELGVQFEELSHTSHPNDMQEAVRNGDGFCLMREGSALLPGLITRPIDGVNWTVDTAMVFKREAHLQILPLIARTLRKEFLHINATGARKKPSQSSSCTRGERMKLSA